MCPDLINCHLGWQLFSFKSVFWTEKLRPNLEEADVGELECSGREAKMVDAFEGTPKFSLKIWQVEVQFIYLPFLPLCYMYGLGKQNQFPAVDRSPGRLRSPHWECVFKCMEA